MGASSGYTSGLNEKVYIKYDFEQKSPTWAQLTDDSDGIILAANEMPDIVDLGAINREGRSIEFFPYGGTASKRIPGVPSLQSIEFAFALDNSNTAQRTLYRKATGSAIQVAIVTKTADTEQTADFIVGRIGSMSKDKGSDTQEARVTFTVDITQDPIDVDQE